MIFRIKSYLYFLWNSKNEHAVHSPFVFDLITKCFYDRNFKPDYTILSNYRKVLLKNKKSIEVLDFGAGSRVFKSNVRPIGKIAKTAGITQKRAELLYRIVHYFQPKSVLEIGTSLGLATTALALGNRNAKIITLEGCPNTLAEAKFQIRNFKFQNIEFINTEFSNYLNTNNQQPTTNNLIYFDGNHSKQATLDYFTHLLPSIENDTLWIFDDIHWSEEMEEAWEIIKNNPKVTVTIDTFQWGLVFFRKEQMKEHFIIRV